MEVQYALPLFADKVRDPKMCEAMAAAMRHRRALHERNRQHDARRTPTGWALLRWYHIRKKCYETGVPFNLLPEDIVPADACPVFGTPFVYGSPSHPQSPTVDKFRPALGYVKGNVNVISRRANQIKSDCSNPADLHRVATWFAEKSRENQIEPLTLW